MRALISVFDKDGVSKFAQELVDLGAEIISSGGTYTLLKQEGIAVTAVEEVTGFKECLGGRVKTLHPNLHAGILANREIPNHMETLAELTIEPIDIVVVNLYPFKKVVAQPDHTLAEAIENIDIGGPTLIRGAAKNYNSVAIVTDKSDYDGVIERVRTNRLDNDYKFYLAKKAFHYTADYDGAISSYLSKTNDSEEYPERITLKLAKKQGLRYGENPHQSAAYYTYEGGSRKGIESAVSLHGKELSYNNINDSQGAIDLALEFSQPVCVAVKHSTPCGVAVGKDILEAYTKAYESDPVSIFGGIICVNRPLDLETAKRMNEVFLEVIIAPSYDDDAFKLLSEKKNLRLLTLESLNNPTGLTRSEFKGVGGGFLLQQNDSELFAGNNQTVTKKVPTAEQRKDLEFAMTVVKHVKSNAIVVAKNGQTLGIGGGEVSRIWAAEAAVNRAGDQSVGAVMASDAFFPFPDVVELCGQKGITAIIQPGGSNKDKLSVEVCDQLGIAMIFTEMRHFKH